MKIEFVVSLFELNRFYPMAVVVADPQVEEELKAWTKKSQVWSGEVVALEKVYVEQSGAIQNPVIDGSIREEVGEVVRDDGSVAVGDVAFSLP